MRRKYAIFLLVFFVTVTFFVDGSISVEWAIQKTLKMEKSPLDIAVSSNGKWIFVLTDQGSILIYSANGKLKYELAVGNYVNGIEAGPKEDILLLTSRKNKTVQVIALEFIHNIDISGSPFRGPVDAPVRIAVFSDFQ